MLSERNQAIARRYFEEVLAGNLAVADEILADEARVATSFTFRATHRGE